MQKYIIMHKKANGEFSPSTFEGEDIQKVYNNLGDAIEDAVRLNNKARDTFVFAITERFSIINNNETTVAIV